MNKKYTIYIDGKYIKLDAKAVQSYTPGVFKATGVFETMLGLGQRVFDLEDHLKRLHRSYREVRLSSTVIHKILKLNRLRVSRIRILAWRESDVQHVAVMALPYTSPKEKMFKVCLIKTQRPASSRWANTKSLDYQLFFDAYQKASVKGFDEALLINRQGYVFEASRANIFIFKEGQLITPPLSSGCLNGITRQKVIRLAKSLSIPVVEKNITPTMIRSASEAFLTNSLWGIKFFKL